MYRKCRSAIYKQLIAKYSRKKFCYFASREEHNYTNTYQHNVQYIQQPHKLQPLKDYGAITSSKW